MARCALLVSGTPLRQCRGRQGFFSWLVGATPGGPRTPVRLGECVGITYGGSMLFGRIWLVGVQLGWVPHGVGVFLYIDIVSRLMSIALFWGCMLFLHLIRPAS